MALVIERPNLTSYQSAFLYNEARFTFTEASTKVGKTFAHIWWIFERAHLDWNKAGYNHWWVAPVYSQTKIAFNRLKAKIVQSGIYKINETNLTIECPTGAIIHFKSAEKPDNLYGEDVYSIVFDEAPRARVTAYYALRSTITATEGVIKLIGNFGGIANWMHQLKEKALTDPLYDYYKITAWDAVREGILSESEVLQAKKDLPDKIFKQLYLAEETESDDQLLPYSVINDFFTNTHVEPGLSYITADVALHGSDRFVVIAWSGWRITEIKIVDKCDAQQAEQILRSMIEKWKVPLSRVNYDADGLGSFLRGYLAGAVPFVNGSKALGGNYKNLKSQCGYLFAKQANDTGIYFDCKIDDRTPIIEELECLQSYALDKDGKMQLLPKAKIKEILGRSPDILDALIMRAYWIAKPKATVRKSWVV